MHLKHLKSIPLAGLLLTALASPALAAAAASHCDIALDVTDYDPKGLNVRSAPDAKSNVVAVLKQQGDWVEVHVTGQSGQWYAIDEATVYDNNLPTGEKIVFKGHGFVHGSKIGGSGLGGGTLVYDRPDEKTGKPIKWDDEYDDDVKVLACSGTWAKVQAKKAIVWSNAVCTNTLTTCS